MSPQPSTFRQEFDETFRVWFVSSEVSPFAKTGGLGDVAGSLPKALATLGNDVRVVLPRYRGISEFRTLGDFPVQVGPRRETAVVRESHLIGRLDGVERTVPVYLIDNYHYFDRDQLYDYPDDAQRFAFFCRAALELMRHLPFQPDILHLNDWQTGPAAVLLRQMAAGDGVYDWISSVFTVHNLQYQGNFGKEALGYLGLSDEFFTPDKLEFYGQVSYLKAGLVYADAINTVSRTYAREIQQPDFGLGMDGVLRARNKDLYGIVNGINYHEYNPETDPRIYRNYSVHDLGAKRENKYALQREMGLPPSDRPLIGMVSRLVDHKGFDLVAASLDDLMRLDLQLVILGTGEPRYERLLLQMRERYPDRMGVEIGFNVTLGQRIYAGGDMFLMPSRSEPCGLGQLIALRYGTIPIVREVGGLKDTVRDYDSSRRVGNGFTFREYTASALGSAVRRAISVYEKRDEWHALMRAAMHSDNSWARSAAEYMGLYAAARTRQQAMAAV